MEREYQIVPVGIDYVCDACNAGVMHSTGVMQTTDPPKYGHQCGSCGRVEFLDAKYPAVRWRRLPAE